MRTEKKNKSLNEQIASSMERIVLKNKKRMGIEILARIYKRLCEEREKYLSKISRRIYDEKSHIEQSLSEDYNNSVDTINLIQKHCLDYFNINKKGLESVMSQKKILRN